MGIGRRKCFLTFRSTIDETNHSRQLSAWFIWFEHVTQFFTKATSYLTFLRSSWHTQPMQSTGISDRSSDNLIERFSWLTSRKNWPLCKFTMRSIVTSFMHQLTNTFSEVKQFRDFNQLLIVLLTKIVDNKSPTCTYVSLIYITFVRSFISTGCLPQKIDCINL